MFMIRIMNWTRTKIICTIGPAVSSKEEIIRLIQAGMNVARLNFSHQTHKEHEEAIRNLKAAREELGVPLAIMLDTKGPEIRIGVLAEGEFFLPPQHRWLLVPDDIPGDLTQVTVRPGSVLSSLQPGMTVLLDNGYISSKVVEVTSKGVVIEIENGGVIKSRKGINIPNVNVNLPIMSERDKEDIAFGCKHDIDIVAASFIRSAEHVIAVKELLKAEGKEDTLVIAKIENREGIENIDSILQVADGIMVARGDLGVEVSFTEVPRLQKMMIRKSCLAGKPAVTATHMLESMITNPRPTRAETSDVANAIYDSSSAVMLSGETAVGRYPIETVKLMKSIVHATEEDFRYKQYFDQHSNIVYHDVPSAVTLATVKTAYSSNAKAIFVFTTSGSTARLLSRLRPMMPIIAMTSKKKSYHQLALLWGVVPYYCEEAHTLDFAYEKITEFALANQWVTYGDLVVVNAGQPFGFQGTTNMMYVESIGDVLVRGYCGVGPQVHGNLTIVINPESKKQYEVRGRIVVITRCDQAYYPLIQEAAGVILQNHIDDVESEKNLLAIAQQLGKPAIVRADEACRILKEGQLVTLVPEKALVYKGIVI